MTKSTYFDHKLSLVELLAAIEECGEGQDGIETDGVAVGVVGQHSLGLHVHGLPILDGATADGRLERYLDRSLVDRAVMDRHGQLGVVAVGERRGVALVERQVRRPAHRRLVVSEKHLWGGAGLPPLKGRALRQESR